MGNSMPRSSPPLTGGSSLLVIFAVLCLTVFSLLSVSTVLAGQRLGDAAAQAVIDYYQTDAQAEAILARLRNGELPDGVFADGDTYSYACPISQTQTLYVQVTVNESAYTVLRWQAVSSVDWQLDESLHVWDGLLPG